MNRKKQYRKPKLSFHGNVKRITKEEGTTGPSDGKTFAFPST